MVEGRLTLLTVLTLLTTTGPVPQPHYPGAAADEPGRKPGREQPALQGRGGRGRRGRLAGHVTFLRFFYWTTGTTRRSRDLFTLFYWTTGTTPRSRDLFYAFFIGRRGRLAGHMTFLRFFYWTTGTTRRSSDLFYASFIGRDKARG